jgi:predicted YcjX-like family ATPase
MNLTDNPSLGVVSRSIRQYRAKQLNIEGLQRNIASVMTALEGDVPQEVRDAISNAENLIEFIRFTEDSDEQTSEVEHVLKGIEAAVSKHSSGNKHDSPPQDLPLKRVL